MYTEYINGPLGMFKHPSEVYHELHAEKIADIIWETWTDLSVGFVDFICWAACGAKGAERVAQTRFISFRTKETSFDESQRATLEADDLNEQYIFGYPGLPPKPKELAKDRIMPFVREETIETNYGTADRVVRVRGHGFPWGRTDFDVVFDPCSVSPWFDEPFGPPRPQGPTCYSASVKTIEINVKDQQDPEDGRKYRCRGFSAKAGDADYVNFNEKIQPFRVCGGWNMTAILPDDYIDTTAWQSAGLVFVAPKPGENPCCISEEHIDHECRYLGAQDQFYGPEATQLCMPIPPQ
jgi:hypothetical protein